MIRLAGDHLSIHVNPNIAHIFFLRGWIEKIGIGKVKMIAHCRDLGFKPPVWKLKDNTVSVTFPDLVVPFNFNEGIVEGVKESMIQIVSLILTEKSVRASEIAKKLDNSYKTLERHISLLKQRGVIEYIGSKRAGGYKVSEKFINTVKK